MANTFVLLIMLSVTITLLLMVYAIVKHPVEKALYLILLSVATLFYTFGNLLEITATSLETAFYGIRVQYMGSPFIMPLAYLFYRDFYGKKRFTPPKLALLFVIPVLSMLSLQAFPLVRLQYADIWYSSNGHIASVQHTNGIAYHLGIALNYACIMLSLKMIIERIRHGGKLQRRQSLVLLSGWLAPLLTNVSFIFFGDAHSYDLTPIAYVTSMAVLLYAALMHNLLDVLPLARAQVIDALEDAFVVCDDELHFLDANLSARRLFPALSSLSAGESMEQVQGFKTEGEVCIEAGGEPRYYKVIATPIHQSSKNSSLCVVFRDITDENRLLEHLHHQAAVDALTGLYNRGTFFELADGALALGRTEMLDVCLLMIDVDHFKQVNDIHGHPCGDAVLKAVADIVKDHFRKCDVVGRYGGEEFAVLMAGASGDQALSIAEKLRKTIEDATVFCRDQGINVTISIGVVHACAGDNPTLETLLMQADAALYLAKGGGRNRACLYHKSAQSLAAANAGD